MTNATPILAPAAEPLAARRAAALTPLFQLPIAGCPRTRAECGGCQRFVALARPSQVTGRCKLGLLPGLINRRTSACGLYRARGTPKRFQDRPVRP